MLYLHLAIVKNIKENKGYSFTVKGLAQKQISDSLCSNLLINKGAL